jgi:hypothetical protein
MTLRCAYCSAETHMYMNGIPICLKCDDNKRLLKDFKQEIQREGSGVPENISASHYANTLKA